MDLKRIPLFPLRCTPIFFNFSLRSKHSKKWTLVFCKIFYELIGPNLAFFFFFSCILFICVLILIEQFATTCRNPLLCESKRKHNYWKYWIVSLFALPVVISLGQGIAEKLTLLIKSRRLICPYDATQYLGNRVITHTTSFPESAFRLKNFSVSFLVSSQYEVLSLSTKVGKPENSG